MAAPADPAPRPPPRPQGLQFEVAPSGFPESLPPAAFPSPQDYAVETARGKALAAGRAEQGRGRGFLRAVLPVSAGPRPLSVTQAPPTCQSSHSPAHP